MRADLYEVLRQVRAEFRIPTLLVTHDLDECFELGDDMHVVREGRIVQSGTPAGILDQPATVEVARLLGIPNLFPAEITALDPGRNTSKLRLDGFELAGAYYPGHFLGDRIWLSVQPGQLRAMPQAEQRPGPTQVPLKLIRSAETPRGKRLLFAGGITVDSTQESAERDNEDWLVEFPTRSLRVLG